MRKITSLLMCSLFFAMGASAQDWTPNVSSSTATMKVATSRATSVTATTAGTDNDHWYILTQKRNGESATYDAGNGQTLRRQSTTYTASYFNTKKASENTNFLVRFITTDNGAYNIQFANGRYVTSNLTSGATPGTYKFYAISGNDTGDFGWNLSSNGSDFQKIVDNNGAGYPLAFWSNGEVKNKGGNNDWFIYPVTFVEEAPLTITYNVVINGQKVATGTSTQFANTPAVLPASLQNDYCTYALSNATVDAAHTTITATATVKSDLPFQFSENAATAQWYKVKIRPTDQKSYLFASHDQMEAQSEFFNTAEFKWAFVGNPYSVKMINKATGDNAALAYEGNVKVARGGSEIKVVDGSSMTWVLCKNGNKGFTLRATENPTCYVHNRQPAISTCSVAEWGGVATDDGSTFTVEAVGTADDYNAQLIADFSSWFDVETAPTLDTYFTLSTSDYNTLKTQYTTLKATCTSEQYEGFVENFYHAVKYPETGYYFLKSTAGGQYGYMSSDGVKVYGNTAKTGVNTVVYLEKHEEEGFVYYTIKIQDKYVNRASQSSEVGMSATAQTPYMADIFKPGVISLTANPNDPYAFLHVSAGNQYALVGWKTINDQNQPINASLWTVEDATHFEVSLNAVNGKSYATFCAPFGVTVADTKANTLEMNNSKTRVTLNEIAEVPANTGVLLVNETGATTATVTINDAAAATVANNALVGTLAPHAKAAGDLFLGNNEGVVGFYDWAGTSLAANRAYIPATTAAGVRALLFDNTTTGVNAATLNNASQKVFDLQGRRVQTAQKGLYIVNGKKVVL